MVPVLIPVQNCVMKSKAFSRIEPAGSERRAAPVLNTPQIADDVASWRDEVARKAYFIYLLQGSPQGQDVRHWFEAEAQLMEQSKAGRLTVVAGS